MSIIIAKFLGLYFLAIGISMLSNSIYFRRLTKNILRDESVLFLGAIIALLIGSLIVSVHNLWMLGWPVIITIIGWWSIIKGFGILAYPKFSDLFSFFLKQPIRTYQIIGIFYALLGLFFVYQGWIAPNL